MIRKITLAAVLAGTAITMTVPASASGLPGDGHYPYPTSYQNQDSYPASYQDRAYNTNGAEQ